jgi:hypothetical protein
VEVPRNLKNHKRNLKQNLIKTLQIMQRKILKSRRKRKEAMMET